MKGHHDLIKMRMASKTPASVTIYDYPFDTDWAKWGDLPRVCTEGQPVVDLDLRFVVGLTVHIESNSEDRANHLFDKCIAMGADIVAASSYPTDQEDPFAKQPSKSRLFFRHFGNQHDNHHFARIN
jgi:hypothetical protein